MSRRPLTAALLILCGAAACGRSSNTTSTTTTNPPVTSSSTTRTTIGRTTAGMVTMVHDQRVTVDGVVAGNGTTVLSGGRVVSDANGSFDVSVGTSVQRCVTDHDSTLQVQPGGGILISWIQGTSWCLKATGTKGTFGIGTGLEAVMKDPVFRVTVDGSGTVLKVDRGFVSVVGTGGSVVVGPAQQVVVPAGGPAGKVGPLQSDAKDNVNFPALVSLAPPPSLGRPTVGNSAALAQIMQKGTLVVQLRATTAGTETPAVRFANAFFTSLARHWDLKLSFTVVPNTPSTTTTTAIGTPDVVVETAPGIATGSTSLPLLSDGKDMWQMTASSVDLFRALQTYLVEDLNSGDYAVLFSQAFPRQQPVYDPFARLVLAG